MIRLLGELPDGVGNDEDFYPMYTDFRHWVAFEQMLLDPELDEGQRLLMMLTWYTDRVPVDQEWAVRQIIWFYRGGRADEEAGSGDGSAKAVYDYEEDAELIYTSFLSAYGVDLAEVAHLHWWKFRAMLLHIPEGTRLATAMGYRAADDSELTEHQRKIKRLYDLERRAQGAPRTLTERDQIILERARQARTRTGKG